MTEIQKFNVLGVSVCAMNLTIASQAILDAVRKRRKGYVCVTGVHGITEAQSDEVFRRILNASFLNTTDGMPLVWLGKYHIGGPWIQRVYGPDLMLELFSQGRIPYDIHVGPVIKSRGGRVAYSGAKELIVLTSGRFFNPGWKVLFTYLIWRTGYYFRILRMKPKKIAPDR